MIQQKDKPLQNVPTDKYIFMILKKSQYKHLLYRSKIIEAFHKLIISL